MGLGVMVQGFLGSGEGFTPQRAKGLGRLGFRISGLGFGVSKGLFHVIRASYKSRMFRVPRTG